MKTVIHDIPHQIDAVSRFDKNRICIDPSGCLPDCLFAVGIKIPLAARKIGYLEAASIPGIAAMDVCIPIVGRACRPDTVIYSFAIGAIMCAVTSVGVPLIMGA